MGKQMTVGKRIALGFALIIAIAIALGAMGSWSMMGAKVESVKLATEYVPEVRVATDLRGAANRVMYQMRGYGMTGEQKYYDQAQVELDAVDKHLSEASELADRAVYLQALRGQVTEAQNAVAEYTKLVEDTVASNKDIESDRADLDQAAAKYMEDSYTLLEHQNERMVQELGGSAAEAGHAVSAESTPSAAEHADAVQPVEAKPCPEGDKTIEILTAGNQRFVSESLENPRLTQVRRAETATKGQHPQTTILTCSDSRVPVETIFDQGIGDVFPVRVAGNVTSVDELGTIEYGVEHLETPLLVVMGHTQCGAVTAAATNATVHGSIPALLDQIVPAVAMASSKNGSLSGEELVAAAITENVWQSIAVILTRSAGVQERVKAGKVKVVGALYHIEDGTVDWLGPHPEQARLLGTRAISPSHATPATQSVATGDAAARLERHEKISLINDVIDLGNSTRIACFKSQALRDPKIIEDANANFDVIDEKIGALRKITRLDEDIKMLDGIEESANEYKTAMNDLLTNWQTLQQLGAEREAAGQTLIDACKTTADAGMEHTDEIANQAATSLARSSTIMIVGLIIGTVVGILSALFIARGITKPLNRAVEALSSSSDQVTSAAGQVAESSQSLAQGASEQASSLEETSASLEEITAMTRQNTDNSNQAKSLAAQAQSDAQSGRESMQRMSGAIDEIKRSADETAGIVKTIEEIAFQTNLLALNAAVEAARAGDAGKGFAVVAEEVRNLAQRASEAARNTGALISESIKNAENGVAISREVAESLAKIADGAGRVNQIASEVAAAGSEQSQGIDQVNIAVSQMNQVTQQNAANSEEGAAAAEELTAQAAEMMRVVEELGALVGARLTSDGAARMGTHARTAHPVEGLPHKHQHQMSERRSTRMPALVSSSSNGGRRSKTPEDVIPLDEEDMADF